MKAQRGGHKAYVTKIIGEVDTLLADYEEKDTARMKTLITMLREKSDTIKSFDGPILNALTEETEIGDEIMASSEFHQKVAEKVMGLDEALSKFSGSVSGSVESKPDISSSRDHEHAKLPKITVGKFNGDYLKFQEWWETYNAAVHSNSTINDAMKFNYLRGYLEGTAASTISGIALSADNYTEAIELLKSRFGNKQALISAHVDKFLSLPDDVQSDDVKELREMYDTIEVNVRSLKSLNVLTEQLGPVLVQIVMKKLPEDIKLLVSRHMMTKVSLAGATSGDSSSGMSAGWKIDELIQFVKQEIESREMCYMVSSKAGSSDDRRVKKHYNNFHTGAKTTKGQKCLYCNNKKHPTHRCDTVTDVRSRKSILRRKGRCFICLRSGHISSNCDAQYKCAECQGRHNISICEKRVQKQTDKEEEDEAVPEETDGKKSTSCVAISKNTRITFLQTAKAIATDLVANVEANVRVLFDPCAQKSFIAENVRDLLGLKTVRREAIIVDGFAGKESSVKNQDIVKAMITSVSGDFKCEIELHVVPVICSPIHNQEIDLARSTCNHLMKLKLSDSSEKGSELSIDVMIGADFYWNFVTREVITGTCGPVAVKTSLGWVLSGPLEIEKSRLAHHAMVTTVMTAPVNEIQSEEALRLDSIVEKFWETEEVAANDEVSDETFVKEFQRKIEFDGSHYSVPLPLKDGIDEIPDNFGLAKGRLFSLLRDLRAKPDILEKYDQLIKQQDIEGYTEIIDPVVSTPGKVHYVPHRPIIRDSKSTPIRMICDPSAKMKNNVSLNECLDPGPSLLPKIFDLLVRNRCFKFALIGDVKSAYMNMRVQEEFRDLLRFMWVSDIHSDNPEIVFRRFVSVLHGLNAAPFILGAVFDNHMNKYAETNQEIVEKFLRDIYMDDLISGAQRFDEVFELYSKSKELMRRGGFRLLKWAINSQELRAKIKESEINVFKEPESVDVDGEQKMVGVSWHVSEDWIESSMDPVSERAVDCKKFTKRFVMKVVASLFDPLGIHSPVMIILKLLLQEVHQLKIDWDVEIPGEIRLKWDNILKNIQKVPVIRVPRFYLQGGGDLNDVKTAQLHGFCDASGKAYGCVVYLRVEFVGGNVINRFVASKTRVNPIKLKNIPRLELLSCLLLSNLLKVIKMALVDIVVDETFCWTDSMDCFWWINQSDKIWKRFIQNRVKKIRTNVPGIKWRHCPGEINPADIPSRGDYLIKKETKKIWLEGPEFLTCSREDWPKIPSQPHNFIDEANSTVGETVAVNATVEKDTRGISKLIDANKFHSFNRLVLVTACVVRFIHNARAKKKKLQQMTGDISLEEKANARVMWLIEEQRTIDDKKFNQLKVSLGAFKDVSDGGVIKLRGRLEHSDLDGAAKTPIFVPKESSLNDLIISDAHRKVLHSGMKDTLTEVRSVYWLVRGRAKVKSFLYRCYLCKKYGARLLQKPPAAPLPDVRAQYSDPFAVTGVDYLGPLYAYPTPTRKDETLEKVHVVLFTCAVTRAVHLDLVPDVSSAAFVNCLRRFVSRRGIPKLIISDNAKCFLGPELRKYTKERDIEWQFIMEKSPWWGGFYERLVQVVKRPLRKILRRSHVTYDELLTIITEIEAVVNCRPLCYLYSDDVEETLTPSHLLTGKRLISSTRVFPGELRDETSTSLTNRVRYLRSLIEQFERRWKHEYLTELREYQRNHNRLPAKQLKIGDVVLISDDKLPRNRWRMGKVEALIPSKDGYVRAVKLRVYSEGRTVSFLNRPVNKLCYFEVSSNDCEE